MSLTVPSINCALGQLRYFETESIYFSQFLYDTSCLTMPPVIGLLILTRIEKNVFQRIPNLTKALRKLCLKCLNTVALKQTKLDARMMALTVLNVSVG